MTPLRDAAKGARTRTPAAGEAHCIKAPSQGPVKLSLHTVKTTVKTSDRALQSCLQHKAADEPEEKHGNAICQIPNGILHVLQGRKAAQWSAHSSHCVSN